MPASPHRIRRQRWLVRADSTLSAFNIRKRLRDDWPDLLLPVFEKAFDQAAGGENVVRIPKIELRFKVASEEKLAELLPELIHHQLVERLREILRGRPQTNKTRHASKTSAPQQSRFETLLHYLRTGAVTWEVMHAPAPRLTAEFKKVCRELRELQDLLRERESPAFYFRLFQLVPVADASCLVRAVVERIPHPWRVLLLEVLVSLLESGGKHFGRHVELELAAVFLSEALALQKSAAAPDFSLIAERILPAQSGRALGQFISALPAFVAVTLFRHGRKLDVFFTNGLPLHPISARDEEMPSTRFGNEKSERLISSEVPDVFQKGELTALAPPAGQSYLREATEEFPLTVTHAGLVLLHPFLPRFFECTGIKGKADVQLSPFVSARAAALLYFLATGWEEIYEYDLAITKVLLGFNPATALCVSAGLIVESDKQEAESLIQSAITHWSALKNTSVAGFRSSFLNRQGLLREDENGWRLQVERLAFDVLLDNLPWSISVVKLPWMARPLYTEW